MGHIGIKVRLVFVTATLLLNVLSWGQGKTSINAATFTGADCGIKINAAEAKLGANPGEIVVTDACGTSKWSPVFISHNNHGLVFQGVGPYSITMITLSGNFDELTGPATLKQVANGSAHENAVLVKGNDSQVQNITCDGSASHGVSPNGYMDGCFQILGNRNSILSNIVVASQGDGITVAGTGVDGVCSSTANDNVIRDNKIHNTNIAKPSSGIVVGNDNSAAGACANNTFIKNNLISTTSGNCIYVTGDIATAKLPTRGTQVNNTRIIGNTVSDCGDSPIEASDMALHTLIQGNVVDCSNNACILTRDAVATEIIRNTIKMEPSVLQFGISVGPPVFQQANLDTQAVVSTNTIRGYIPHAGISVTQSGAKVVNNDIEETYRTVAANGSGLGGAGIACNGANVRCSVEGNQIKRVLVGIDFNPGAVPQNSGGLAATGNLISEVGTGINLYQVRCANCNFSNNTMTKILTVAIQDNGPNADGTGTSHAEGNKFNLSGWDGATPKTTVRNLPNYQR
jgi:hypothetical protein